MTNLKINPSNLNSVPSTHIDHVIRRLEFVIQWCIKNNDRMGYFAAMYEQVTIEMDRKIDQGYFENNEMLMQFVVIFAEHYLSAFETYMRGQDPPEVWQLAFKKVEDPDLIVLQHLLLGMNAHIRLDLAVTVVNFFTSENIGDFKSDFYKINEVLASLVDEVQDQISEIYRPMKIIDKLLGRFDEYLVNRIMVQFRDGAWELAEELVLLSGNDRTRKILQTDKEVAQQAERTVGKPLRKIFAPLMFIFRKGEKVNVGKIINHLHRGATYEKWEDWAVG